MGRSWGLLLGDKGGRRRVRSGQGRWGAFRRDEIPVKKVQGIALLQRGRRGGGVLGAARLAAAPAATTTPAPGATPGFTAALAAVPAFDPGRGRWSGGLLIGSLRGGKLGAWLRSTGQGPGTKGLFTPGLISPGLVTPNLLASGFVTPNFLASGFLAPGFPALHLVTPGFLASGFLPAGLLAAWFVAPGGLLRWTLPGGIPVPAAGWASARLRLGFRRSG